MSISEANTQHLIPLPQQLACVIFDWDGTLLDSSQVIITAHLTACQDLGLAIPTRRQVQSMLGMDKSQVCAAITQDSAVSVDDYYCQFQRSYSQAIAGLQLFPESIALLQLLDDIAIPATLATNKPQAITLAELRSMGLHRAFTHCDFADLSTAKPHPAMLHHCMQAVDATPATSMMVGDQIADIEAAHAAGVTSITLIPHSLPHWAKDYAHMTYFCHHQTLIESLSAYAPITYVSSS